MNSFYDLLNHLLPKPGTPQWVVLAEAFVIIMEHFLFFCMAIYALVLLRRVWRTLAAIPKSDRTAQRVPLIKRTVIRFCATYLLWWLVFLAVGYGSDAMDRRDAADCKRITSPEYKDYYINECTVGGDRHGYRTLLRLYATGTNQLIAEEFVSNAEGELTWEKTRMRDQVDKNGVYVIEPSKPYIRQWGEPSVEIELPPPWWDRMRAKLP